MAGFLQLRRFDCSVPVGRYIGARYRTSAASRRGQLRCVIGGENRAGSRRGPGDVTKPRIVKSKSKLHKFAYRQLRKDAKRALDKFVSRVTTNQEYVKALERIYRTALSKGLKQGDDPS